jgi:hypothetical protein
MQSSSVGSEDHLVVRGLRQKPLLCTPRDQRGLLSGA